ncbi:MAG: NUDIX hydrolase [Candidatus Eisenbacteria bacterium]
MSAPSDPGLRDAAVLVPVFRDRSGESVLVLIRRTEGGIHGGQLAFPGGQRAASDASLYDTALRETEEEIGLAPQAVTRLAELPVLHTRVSGFRVQPYLASISRPARWQPHPAEIAEVLEWPIASFARPGAHDSSMERFDGWPEPMRIPFYHVGPYRLWGVSYRILHPLLPRLLAGEFHF